MGRGVPLRIFLPHLGQSALFRGFPGASVVKNQLANTGDMGLIPGSERSPGERNGNPLQYSYLGNPIDRGAWWARVHGVPESDTTERERDTCNMSNTDKQSSISEIY